MKKNIINKLTCRSKAYEFVNLLGVVRASEYFKPVIVSYPYYGKSSTLIYFYGNARLQSEQKTVDARIPLCSKVENDFKVLMKLRERELRKRMLIKQLKKPEGFQNSNLHMPV